MNARMRLSFPLLPFLPLARAQAARSNILMIAVDDLNTDLGCYGHHYVLSPNIDALALRGARFEHGYAQYPVCNPSRTSLLSGRYPERTGVLDNRANPRTHLAGVAFLPEFLRRNGYFTASVGKIFHDGMDGKQDWDHYSNPKGSGGAALQGEGRNLTGGKFAFFEWRAAEGADEDQPDGQIAAEAVRCLEQRPGKPQSGKPWFLAVGFRKPHDKYIAPKRYFEPYPLSRIPDTPGPPGGSAGVPQAAYPPANHNLGPAEAREFRRAYYACISFMDAQVGKVLQALEKQGLARDTLVIFFGDHGLHLGEHNWWNKVTLFERSARAPYIVAGPPVAEPGRACRRTVELLDFYPTIADYAGLAAPPGLDGRSLLPLLANPAAPWDKPAYTVVTRGAGKLGRSIRTERFRYTEWDEGRMGVELYDHDTDPGEFRNCADDAAYKRHRASMQALLRKRRPAAGGGV